MTVLAPEIAEPDTKAPPFSPDTERPEGWQLCKPREQLMAWDEARLLAAVMPLSDTDTGALATVDPAALRTLADLMELLQSYVVDVDAYRKLASGPGGMERALTLAVWYAGRLGESAS